MKPSTAKTELPPANRHRKAVFAGSLLTALLVVELVVVEGVESLAGNETMMTQGREVKCDRPPIAGSTSAVRSGSMSARLLQIGCSLHRTPTRRYLGCSEIEIVNPTKVLCCGPVNLQASISQPQCRSSGAIATLPFDPTSRVLSTNW